MVNLMGLEVPDWKYNDMKASGWPDQQIYLSVLGSEQLGSQFWMNYDYPGPEPDLATKAAYSTATRARDWIGGYAATLEAIGVKVSPGVAAMADYPITAESARAWAFYPAVGPVAAAVKRYGETLIQSAGTAVSQAVEPREGAGGGDGGAGGGLPDLPAWLVPVGLALAAALVLPALLGRGRGAGYG